MKNNLCIYHSADLDGICSAAIVHRAMSPVDLLGLDYDEDPPMDEILKYKTVIIVDFSLSIENMDKLTSRDGFTYYVDHHKKAVNEIIDKFGTRITSHCSQESPAACFLTWEYFMQSKPPLAVELLSLYDTWQHDIDPRCVAFNGGIQCWPHAPEDQIWDKLLIENDKKMFAEVMTAGERLQVYWNNLNRRTMDKKLIDGKFFARQEDKIDQYNALIINGSKGSGKFEAYFNKKKHHLCVAFERTRDKWVYHLYTMRDDFDVSEIAALCGGGGHKGAAGFSSCLGPEFFIAFDDDEISF